MLPVYALACSEPRGEATFRIRRLHVTCPTCECNTRASATPNRDVASIELQREISPQPNMQSSSDDSRILLAIEAIKRHEFLSIRPLREPILLIYELSRRLKGHLHDAIYSLIHETYRTRGISHCSTIIRPGFRRFPGYCARHPHHLDLRRLMLGRALSEKIQLSEKGGFFAVNTTCPSAFSSLAIRGDGPRSLGNERTIAVAIYSPLQ